MLNETSELLEQLQRQIDEFEALKAVFPDGWESSGAADGEPAALLLSDFEQQALVLAQQTCEAAGTLGGNCSRRRSSSSPEAEDEDEGTLAGLPLLSGTVRPPGLQYGGQQVALRFTLPRWYPAGEGRRASCGRREGTAATGAGGGAGEAVCGSERPEPHPHRHRQAVLQVECSGPRHVHERLTAAVRAVAEREAEAGCECLLLAVDALRDALEELAAHQGGISDEAAQAEDGSKPAEDGPGGGGGSCGGGSAGLLCALVWLHHLKSLAKRKLIVQWARELGLAGACKPGFPGVVVVEGHSADVREFLARMRALSWQAMQVRGQDFLPLAPASPAPAAGRQGQAAARPDGGGLGARAVEGGVTTAANGSSGGGNHAAAVAAVRRLRSPLPFIELDEAGGMSQLGGLCRAAGLHEVFLTALKL